MIVLSLLGHEFNLDFQLLKVYFFGVPLKMEMLKIFITKTEVNTLYIKSHGIFFGTMSERWRVGSLNVHLLPPKRTEIMNKKVHTNQNNSGKAL